MDRCGATKAPCDFFFVLLHTHSQMQVKLRSGIDRVGGKFPVKIFLYLQLVTILTPYNDIVYLYCRYDSCYLTDRLAIWYLDGRSGIGIFRL